MGLAFMLSNNRFFTLFALMTVLACGLNTANAKGVCAKRGNEKVQQIDIFDGDPSELAFLAPDDDQTAPNTYTLNYIYDKGGIVTIRCKYDSGFVNVVQLKNKVRQCKFSKNKAGQPNLVCK